MNNSENKIRFMIGSEEDIYLVTMDEEMSNFYIWNGKWYGYGSEGSSSWTCYPPESPERDVTYIYESIREVSFDEWFDYSKRTGTDKYIDKSKLQRLMGYKKEDVSTHVDFSVFNDDCPF